MVVQTFTFHFIWISLSWKPWTMTGLMLSGWTSHPCEWDTPLQAWEILQPTPLIIQLHYWVKSNFLQSLISLFPPKVYSRITSRVWQGSHQESLFYDIQIVATLTGLFSETQTKINIKETSRDDINDYKSDKLFNSQVYPLDMRISLG